MMMAQELPPWILNPPKRLLLDTEPLVGYIVGSFDPRLLGANLTARVATEDFEVLGLLVSQFEIVATPHLLAEVNSWLNQLGWIRSEIRAFFARYIPSLEETFTQSATLASNEHFSDLGLTDLSIAHAAKAADALVLTTDGRLLRYLYDQDIPALLHSEMMEYRRNAERS
jgi:hypothetical protein